MKKTPLYDAHRALGAKMMEFGGWEMPVQYSSILEEHRATRERAGLFDVSHMGEAMISGRDAEAFVDFLVSNDARALPKGKAMYAALLNERGGVVDDLLVYRLGADDFLLVVNASNAEKDLAWIASYHKAWAADGKDVSLENQSSAYAQLAVQGPLAESIVQSLTIAPLKDVKFFRFIEDQVAGIPTLISRTGYTGEDGFELYCPAENAVALWEKLMEAGSPRGMLPVGLGARDTLRLEASLPLYGHELGEEISPLDAGLQPFVKMGKSAFVGRDALANLGEPTRMLIGLALTGKGIPRADCRVEKDGRDIGYVTSGTHSPTLQKGVAMALVERASAQNGDDIAAVIRGQRVPAKVIPLPIYRRGRK